MAARRDLVVLVKRDGMRLLWGCPDHRFDVVLPGPQARHVGTTDAVKSEPSAVLALSAMGQEVPAAACMSELERTDLPLRGISMTVGISDLDHPTFGDGNVERSRC